MPASYQDRALAYLRACNPNHNIRVNVHNGNFEMESGPVHFGDTYWYDFASLSDPKYTGGRVAIIDHTGDSDVIQKYLD